MARIDIDVNTVKNANYAVPQMVSGVSNIKRSIGLLKWRIDPEIMNRRNVRDKIENIIKELGTAEKELNDTYVVTEDILGQYLESEQTLSVFANKFE